VNLIYSVVRRKEIFERLAALTLPIAIKVKPAPLPCADLSLTTTQGAADQARRDSLTPSTIATPSSSHSPPPEAVDSTSVHDMSHADPAVSPTVPPSSPFDLTFLRLQSLVSTLKVERLAEGDRKTSDEHTALEDGEEPTPPPRPANRFTPTEVGPSCPLSSSLSVAGLAPSSEG
jgi:hypothetical protein